MSFRILFTFVGGRGHFEPLVPIALEARARGHAVAFGCSPSMCSLVEAEGFRALLLGRARGRARERTALRPVDREREERELRERFASTAARNRLPHTLELARQWRPDVLVCDETDFATPIAAERLGLPHATVLVIASGAFVRPDVVADALDALRAEHGLAPDPNLEAASRYLVLSPFPPSFRDPRYPLPATAHSFRPATPRRREPGAGPPWPVTRPGSPTIYFTLGTVFNLESGDLFSRVLDGLEPLPIEVVATLGPDLDAVELGPRPAHVHIERYLAQSDVLPHCDAVVSHGGSGSVLGASAHGLPSLLLPMGADQPLNAERCLALGTSRVLDPLSATPESVAEGLTQVLGDPSCRVAAEGLRDEIAELPGLECAVDRLEGLAGGAPLRTGSR